MEKYRLVIKPLSPFQTPLHSDTIFGHICWALRYLKNENALLNFLGEFNDINPPLILSSGFPKDYLPMPILRPLTIEEEKTLQEAYRNKLEFARELKELKKVSYIRISAIELLKDTLSYFNLYTKHLQGEILLENPQLSKTEEVWHNAKNRLTDKVIEGNLFAKRDIFYYEDVELNVYINNSYFNKKELCEIFDFISKSGYGADKSVGRGLFKYELIEGWDLPEAENPNAFMILSYYHPRKNDYIEGFYNVTTKFGKIGGHWASGIDGGPFKMPLIMLEPGSVFISENYKEFYGSLIPKVHKNPNIVQYGIAIPLKVRIV